MGTSRRPGGRPRRAARPAELRVAGSPPRAHPPRRAVGLPARRVGGAVRPAHRAATARRASGRVECSRTRGGTTRFLSCGRASPRRRRADGGRRWPRRAGRRPRRPDRPARWWRQRGRTPRGPRPGRRARHLVVDQEHADAGSARVGGGRRDRMHEQVGRAPMPRQAAARVRGVSPPRQRRLTKVASPGGRLSRTERISAPPTRRLPPAPGAGKVAAWACADDCRDVLRSPPRPGPACSVGAPRRRCDGQLPGVGGVGRAGPVALQRARGADRIPRRGQHLVDSRQGHVERRQRAGHDLRRRPGGGAAQEPDRAGGGRAPRRSSPRIAHARPEGRRARARRQGERRRATTPARTGTRGTMTLFASYYSVHVDRPSCTSRRLRRPRPDLQRARSCRSRSTRNGAQVNSPERRSGIGACTRSAGSGACAGSPGLARAGPHGRSGADGQRCC